MYGTNYILINTIFIICVLINISYFFLKSTSSIMQFRQLSIYLLINDFMCRIWKQCFIVFIRFKIIFFNSRVRKIQQIFFGHICYNQPAFASCEKGFLIFNF